MSTSFPYLFALTECTPTALHYVWDNLFIAKAIRETPSKYSQPLASHRMESALRGSVYDSYVRRIVVEGILDKWTDDIPGWPSCPSASFKPDTLWQEVLTSSGHLTGRAASGKAADDDLLCPYHWARPIHDLACHFAWPKEVDEPPYKQTAHPHVEMASAEEDPEPVYLELNTPMYAGVVKDKMIIEKLLAQAGIRLSVVLNYLFADPEETALSSEA